MKTYTFYVNGMHCKACVALTESELCDVPGVSAVTASLANLNVAVTGEFGGKGFEEIARDLSKALEPHGYTVTVEKQQAPVRWADFKFAAPIAAAFIGLFIALQKLGIVNLVTSSDVNYGTAFVIGLIASVSTCMAVVGGLVLSMSASFAKEGNNFKPQILFHAGRLISFFILGGIIGAAGAAFQMGAVGTFVLGLVIGFVMLLLGINLLDIFPWAKKFQPTFPGFIGKRAQRLKNMNHTVTPLLVGTATFFLPCGFTQSMQIYTLTAGSFLTGALLMAAFALGTLPVLGLISFSSFNIHNSLRSGVFFKAAGLVVIFFGIFNIVNSLVAKGLIRPLFSF